MPSKLRNTCEAAQIDDVTIIVKTFERPKCLATFLRSVHRVGWKTPIIVADDSRRPYGERMPGQYMKNIQEYIELPYDSGVSAGRNAALERVRTPFFVLCDDDFLLDHRANLALMRSMIMTHNLDVLGGAVYQDGGVDRFSGYLIEEPGSLIRHEPIRYEPPVTLCDTVPNFFIAKTDFARTELHGWNPRLKLCEHAEFFFRAKKIEARVGYSEEFGVLHRKCGESAYFAMRRRNFYQQFFREAGIRAWRRMDGLTISMDEDFNGEVEHGAAAQNGTGRYS